MSTYHLQTAQANEAQRLRQLCEQSFFEAYTDLHSRANIQTYSAAHHRLADIQAMFAQPSSCVRLAYHDGQPVGFSVVRRAEPAQPLGGGAHTVFELQKLYLLASHYGQGLGQQLFDDVLTQLKHHAVSHLWLHVSDQNPRAKQFYARQGFKRMGSGPRFYVGTDELSSSLLALSLTAG